MRAQVLAKGATRTSTASIALSSTKPLVQINASPFQSSLSLTHSPLQTLPKHILSPRSSLVGHGHAHNDPPRPPATPLFHLNIPLTSLLGIRRTPPAKGSNNRNGANGASSRNLASIRRDTCSRFTEQGGGSEGSAYDGGTRTYMLQRKHSDLFVYSSRIRATATVHNLI